jgi:branched-chain amino acid transport system ATP-binding protein
MSACLEVTGLVAGYERSNPIVRGASITVESGQIVTLIGPNGAGKSTCVRAIAGLVPIEAGHIQLNGLDITTVPAHGRVATGLGFVPQSDNIFADLSIDENLQLGIPRNARREGRARAEALLASVPEFRERRARRAGGLSGGQRQVLAVARALMAAPTTLLLDEPTAGLSPRAVTELLTQCRQLADEGLAILMVEQNVRAAFTVSDQVVVLVQGAVAMAGTPQQLSADPRLAAYYLGGRSST